MKKTIVELPDGKRVVITDNSSPRNIEMFRVYFEKIAKSKNSSLFSSYSSIT